MTAFRAEIFRVYGFDSIRIFFVRGEIRKHTGNSRGILTRRTLVCEMLV